MLSKALWWFFETLDRAGLWLFLIVAVLVWGLSNSCPQKHYPQLLANVTSYQINPADGRQTPGGVLVVGPKKDVTAEFIAGVDAKVQQLDICLQKAGFNPIKRKWFGVYVPADWYVSPCTGQQLIPSRADYKLCEAKLDPDGNPIKIPEQCMGVTAPTMLCPCPCNFRATVQDNFWIVTAPDLHLFKTELTRLVTGVNAPWANERTKNCLN